MSEIQNTAAGRGHVRAVFSARCRGYAAPVDLVRAHLRAVGRVALRGRLVRAFAGYLVTDPDDAQLRGLEIAGKSAPFSEVRGRHRMSLDRLASTGRGPWSFHLHSTGADAAHGCLDAPDYMAAGAMRSYRCDQSGEVLRAPMLGVRP